MIILLSAVGPLYAHHFMNFDAVCVPVLVVVLPVERRWYGRSN